MPEEVIVRQCAPTLAGIKTGSLFPYRCADGESLMEDIRGRAATAGLEKELRLLGYRTDAEEILASADLYVCSSRCNEALSFAILEAMNAGLPLVVTDVGGNRDLAETEIVCGTVVGVGDTEAFAASIKALMDDPALREEYSAAALRKVAARFDLNKLAQDVFATYNETEN